MTVAKSVKYLQLRKQLKANFEKLVFPQPHHLVWHLKAQVKGKLLLNGRSHKRHHYFPVNVRSFGRKYDRKATIVLQSKSLDAFEQFKLLSEAALVLLKLELLYHYHVVVVQVLLISYRYRLA